MLNVGNLLDSSSSSLQITRCPNFLPVSSTLNCDSSTSGSLYSNSNWCSNLDTQLGNPISTNGGTSKGNNGNIGIKVFARSKMIKRCEKKYLLKSLDDYVKSWVQKKIESGVPEKRLSSVRVCQETYHETCVREILGFSTSNNFKCPHHACFVCKQNKNWRCVRCPAVSHPKCAPWPDKVIYLTTSQLGRAVCWRHPTDWHLEKKDEVPTSDVEFQISLMWKDLMEQNMEPPQYEKDDYLVKKKREDTDAGIGCTNCKADNEMCSEDCVCRGQSISCSKSCHCSEACTNRPFRKEKKVKIVGTQFCGWGLEAAEPLKRGDFVIEYIGEVINDALWEQRLWDIRFRGDEKFYMCEIRKDFTIDATFKGNVSRFLNHSCEPNCKLEKWQVDGETRVGVFAAQSINVGEPLTYDYRFVHFGKMVKCQCGSKNCQGYLGTKRKEKKLDIKWGSKHRRSSMSVLEIICD
ncbi:hypothetical protein MKX01_009438 [Papaver californicum]|nr:hypothetical protein MKX01_009438 [Papaver californicum]